MSKEFILADGIRKMQGKNKNELILKYGPLYYGLKKKITKFRWLHLKKYLQLSFFAKMLNPSFE